MRMGVSVITIVALTLGASLAPADPTPGQHDAATQLLHVMGIERSMMAGATTMVDIQIQQNPTLAPFRDVMLKWAGRYMTWDAVSAPLIDLYAQTFTESELKELTAFYGSPTGQKALMEMPGLMQKGAALGVELAKAHASELDQMIRDRAQELQKMSDERDSGGP